MNAESNPADVPKTIQRLGVVGSGVMGLGIAQIALQAGMNVCLHDAREGAAAAVLARGVGALLEGDGLALGAPDVGVEAAGDARTRSGVTSHVRPSVAWAGGSRCAAPA